MNRQRAKFWIKGALFRQPVPYHRDYDAYAAGQRASAWALVVGLPIACLAIGFAAGRYL